MPDHPTRAQLLAWGVDYIEIVNTHTYDEDSVAWCNDTGGFGQITGTDMHDPKDVSGWTLLKADNLTAGAIMKELVERDTTIIYDNHGSVDQSVGAINPVYQIFKPIIHTGYYFYNDELTGGFIDWTAFGVGIAYTILALALFEGAKFGGEKLLEKIKEKRRSKAYQEYDL